MVLIKQRAYYPVFPFPYTYVYFSLLVARFVDFPFFFIGIHFEHQSGSGRNRKKIPFRSSSKLCPRIAGKNWLFYPAEGRVLSLGDIFQERPSKNSVSPSECGLKWNWGYFCRPRRLNSSDGDITQSFNCWAAEHNFMYIWTLINRDTFEWWERR